MLRLFHTLFQRSGSEEDVPLEEGGRDDGRDRSIIESPAALSTDPSARSSVRVPSANEAPSAMSRSTAVSDDPALLSLDNGSPDRRSPNNNSLERRSSGAGGGQPAARSIDDLKQVLNVLRAYTLTFGRPDSALELRAIVGAIVANLAAVTIENRQLEEFIDQTLAAFESLGMEAALVDVSAQLLAEQVDVWLREQVATVTNTVSAYLQQFAPDDAPRSPDDLLGLVQTVVAALNDGSLSRSGARVLVARVVASFDLTEALSRWVAPEWVALAQRVASYVGRSDLQVEVRSIAWAYVQKFQAILSPQLIEQIMETGPLNVSPAEFLAGDLGEFSQMLYYKFQLLAADPVVTKSHAAIAADLHRAIADFKAKQGPGLDMTAGLQTGELEVSSPFARARNRFRSRRPGDLSGGHSNTPQRGRSRGK